MRIAKGFLTIILIITDIADVFGDFEGVVEDVDPLCLGCICESTSKCDRSLGCDSIGACGLFRMHKPFWIDGGENVVGSDNPESEEAWIRCARNVVCAAKTVTNYVKRYQTDCDGNGRIDCVDYFWIHKLGGSGCVKRPKFSDVEKKLKICLAS